MVDYSGLARVLKVLSEPTRLQIIGMLSTKEMCACQLLEELSVTQSTLSHHMKVLMDCGLVVGRKDKTWMYYRLQTDEIERIRGLFDDIINDHSAIESSDEEQSKKCQGE